MHGSRHDNQGAFSIWNRRDTMPPLPRSFASYISRSARFSIEGNAKSASLNQARPMLTLTGEKSPSAWFTAFESFRPTTTAPLWLISGSTAANSSPPNRATTSPERTARHSSYVISQRKRKRVEEGYGWLKNTGLMRRMRHRGRDLALRMLMFSLAAYNIIRIRNLRYA